MKVTCVRGWNSPVWDVKLSCTQRRGVSSAAAMTMTTASGCVEYKAIQGGHKGSRPLIGRPLCRRSEWINELARSDDSVSTCNCGVSGIRGHICMEGWLIWYYFILLFYLFIF